MASRRRKVTGNRLVCPGGKGVSFSSESAAREGLRRMRERAHRFGRTPPVRYYTCELCGKYHLTSKRPQKVTRSLIPEPDDGHVPALVTPEGRFYNIADAAKLLGLSPASSGASSRGVPYRSPDRVMLAQSSSSATQRRSPPKITP
jgi:hypothetical protein